MLFRFFDEFRARTEFLALVACTIFAFLTGAQAQNAQMPRCTDHGSSSFKEMQFSGADASTLAALRISLNVDMTANAENGPGPQCARGIVQSGGRSFIFIGSNQTIPPRIFASPQDSQHRFYLSAIPKPDAAMQWERATHESSWPKFDQSQLMYMFAMTTRTQRSVYRFFDAIPDDQHLAQLMCDAEAGLLKPVAVTGASAEPHKPLQIGPSEAPVRHAECHVRLSGG